MALVISWVVLVTSHVFLMQTDETISFDRYYNKGFLINLDT